MQQKHVEPNNLGHMPYAPYMCQAAGASIIGGGAPSWITERHYYYEAAGCRPAVGAKRVENGVNAIQKWVPFTPKCRPQKARESPSKLASLTRRVGEGDNGIQKWVPFTPKCSQKRWRLGLRPRPSNSEEERLWRSPVWHAELKVVLTLFKNGFHLHPNVLKSVGGWGSAPDSQIVRESAFDACQSDTPRGAPIPIFAPGARNPRYATGYVRADSTKKNPRSK